MQTHVRERDEWLAPKQLAAELGCHVASIYRAVERGTLPAFRLSDNGALRIPRSAITTRPKEQP